MTRARLLESGQALFAERGLHGVTTHDIARQAGLAAGTFYLHFKDKRELFREIAGRAIASLRERMEAASVAGDDTETGVRRHAEALVSFAADNRDVVRMLFSGDTDAAAVEADVLNDLAASIAETRQKRRAAGEGSPSLDPTVLSQAVVGMWARVIAWWCEDPSRASASTLVDTLSRIQLAGTDPA